MEWEFSGGMARHGVTVGSGLKSPSFGIAIGTFGAPSWRLKGDALVIKFMDMAEDVVHVHAETLCDARNCAAIQLNTDWIIFLDADDDLKSDYIKEMKIGAEPGMLLQPATLGCVDGKYDNYPVVIPPKDLYKANYLVIGTAVERERFIEVGGFRDLPALEDWDLWIRLVISGCSVKRVPFAVYIVNVMPDSRNQNTQQHHQVYRKVQRDYAQQRDVLRGHAVL